MSESGQDGQNEDFFGDFHAANGNTAPQNNDTNDVNNPNGDDTVTKVEETVTQPVVQDNTEQFATSATNATPADTTSADFFNLDFSSINAQLMDSNHVDFSEIKFPNGSLPATSDLLDIDFGNLPVEPTPPTPGTPSIEVHFATSDQNSEVSNETKSDTDSNAPTDSWSVSTQYPESRGDMESGRDDVKSEQSLDDKSQLAEDGSDAFDFPTPKGSTHSEQKDDAASTNMTDAVEFGDFPAPNTQSEQSTSEAAKSSEAGSADGPLTPVRPSEDKVAEASQDDTLSVSSDTAPVTNTNDFAFEDEFKAAPGPSDDSNSGSEGKTGHSSLEQSTEQSGLEAPKTAPENVSEVTPAQPSEDFFAAVEAKETTTSADFDFPAPSTDDQPQQEQNKPREDESKAATTNDFAFETPAPSNNNSGTNTNDFTFDNEVTSATSAEDKQPEEPVHVQPGEPTQVKSDNDFEFEGEFTSTQTSTAAQAVTEEKQPEHVEEGTAVEAEPSTVKTEHDGEFEGEFTATPAVPNKTEDETKHSHSDEKKSDNDVKSDTNFEFEGEFTAAPTPSVPATNTNIDTNISNTNTNASTNQDDDDFFDSDFQAAPTVPQVPQEQPQAPKSGGTFEADFDEDFEDFAQAPTTTQPPVQPVQPPQAVTAPTPWLFEGDEAAVRDRVHALVSTLFPAPAPSKALPDINTTVEEKLEELRSSAPAVDAAPVVPAPSVFAEHLKALLASVGPTTPVPGLQPARARAQRSPFDTHLSKKEILSLFKKETSSVLHVSPRPTLPSARGSKKRKNSATPSPTATPSAAKQPVQPPKTATPAQPKLGVLPPTPPLPKTSPTPVKTNVQVPAPAVDTRPKLNETPEEKSNRIVNELVQSVPDLSFMLLEEFRPSVNVM